MSSTQEQSVDAESVIWAYRMILGREPENRHAVEHHVATHASLAAMRQVFFYSDESRSILTASHGGSDLLDSVKGVGPTSTGQEQPVDAESVTWAYRMILGREPENPAVVKQHVRGHGTLAALRRTFFSSEEFKAELDRYREAAVHHPVARENGYTPGVLFYLGEHCNYWPRQQDFASETFLEDYVLKGWMPAAPSINSRTKVTTFGSCFAIGIANHLSRLGYSIAKDRDPDIYISRIGEGFVNIYSILQQFEWALENKAPPANLWHGFNAEEFGYSELIRERTRDVFLDTEFFIITLGLSEVWVDEATGGVLWRGVPRESYDPSRHRFKVCTVDETKLHLSRIHEIVRKHVPAAKLLFTLSPIPLLATFRPVGCVTANSVSKAILRVAVDEFYREHPDELNRTLFYFPSYEIAGELFTDKFVSDCRHPGQPIVDFIMQTFEALHCETGRSLREMNRLFHERRLANRRSIDLAQP